MICRRSGGRNGRAGECLDHDSGDLDVVVKGQVVASDDVDVGLGELAVAPFLGTLATPCLLYLVAPEREVELAGVLEHVASQGHGEVVVQAEAAVAGIVAGLQPAQDVDLLVDLALAQQLVERFYGSGLDGGEAVQLERRPQLVDDGKLDELVARAAARESH